MGKKYDIIIAGAGMAGCTLAIKLAKAGFRVALIDKKQKKQIGHAWEVAVEKKIFSRIGFKMPDNSIKSESPEFYRFYANNLNDYVEMDAKKDSVFYIQHNKLNNIFLNTALKSGAHFYSNHNITGPVLEKDYASGVTGSRKKFFLKSKFIFKGSVIVDTSGYDKVLVRYIPPVFNIQNKILDHDCASAYQETREVNPLNIELINEKMGIAPGIYYARIGKYHAYQAMHLRRNNTINLIFGASLENKDLTGKSICKSFLKNNPYFGNKISGGGKIIPIRRSIDTMAGNGFLCIGDAACMIVPTTGSGVSSAMYAADVAASTIIEAFNSGDFSLKTLWKYNYNYQVKRGAILASYDVIRLFLQSQTMDKLNQIFKAGLFKDENFIQTYSSTKIIYDMQHIMNSFKKIISNYKLLPLGINLVQLIRDSEKVLHHYRDYPQEWDKDTFLNWQAVTEKCFRNKTL